MMDKVFIKGLEVEGIIGIFQWEREVRQLISVDIEMDFDNQKAAKSDSIDDALNYKLVGKRVTSLIKNSKFKIPLNFQNNRHYRIINNETLPKLFSTSATVV